MHVLSDPSRPARLNRRHTDNVISVMSQAQTLTQRLSLTDVALRVLGAAALAISSYVHLHGAHFYKTLGDSVTQADLFYAQGAVAAAVALWVLLTGNRWAWVAVGLVGAASFAAVVVYRYVDVGSIGPIPNMYEPSWQTNQKLLSAYAEAAAVVIAAGALVSRSRRTPPDRATAH
jgi:hypothetical protein